MKAKTENDRPIIRGKYRRGTVWINGKQLRPGMSLEIINHSPDGFGWGHAGSGAAQLALAILLDLLKGDTETAVAWHQDFKTGFVQRLPQCDFEVRVPVHWAKRIERQLNALRRHAK